MAAALFAATALAATPPQFPGGETALTDYLAQNMKYPAAARENGVEGVVSVSFTVQPDGSIGTIKIDRLIDPDLEQESIRLVKSMPAWQPATDDSGKAVAGNAHVDVTFELQ